MIERKEAWSMKCFCSRGKTEDIKIEGDIGADPIWCSKCGCNFDLEEFSISADLKVELSSWGMKYGEWFDWDREEYLPNGEMLEEEFNKEGELLAAKVIKELAGIYKVQYIPSSFRENGMMWTAARNSEDTSLPKHKFDFTAVKKLKKMDRNEILPLLPSLMEWIQDINWPIAKDVAQLLLTYPEDIIHLIKMVLATNDEPWKYWCLEYLVKELPKGLRSQFKDDLIRLTEVPTDGEKLEELDELAKEILEAQV